MNENSRADQKHSPGRRSLRNALPLHNSISPCARIAHRGYWSTLAPTKFQGRIYRSLLDVLHQLPYIDGLDPVIVKSCSQRLLDMGWHGITGKHNAGCPLRRRIVSQHAQDLVGIDIRQMHFQDDQIRPHASAKLQSAEAVTGLVQDVVGSRAQKNLHQQRVGAVGFDVDHRSLVLYKNFFVHDSIYSGSRRMPACLTRRYAAQRNTQAKASRLARRSPSKQGPQP